MHVPLKPPAPVLRATPSTPMLRASGTQTARVVTRKSESNLRAFNTLPTNVAFAEAFEEDEMAPPRRLYERFLDTTPGVVRQGDGWGSLSSGKALHKPSSMLSLRERARALISGPDAGNQTLDEGTRRNSRQLFGARPQTPMSVLSSSTQQPTQKGWGIFKRMGRKAKKPTDE